MRSFVIAVLAVLCSTLLHAAAPVVDKLNATFSTEGWGEVLPRGSANQPASGEYPSSERNGYVLQAAVLAQTAVNCAQGGKHAVSIILDKNKYKAAVETPAVSRLDLLEIHAQTATDNLNFTLEERAPGGAWKMLGSYTTRATDSVYRIPLSRSVPTAFRIANASGGRLVVHQLTSYTQQELQQIKLVAALPASGDQVSANLTKTILLEFDAPVKIGSAALLLNGQPVAPNQLTVQHNKVYCQTVLAPGQTYRLQVPAQAFTDTKGNNPNAEMSLEFSTYKAVPLPKGYTAQLDVVYVTQGDWQGRVDLYLPPAGNKPTPIVINMHGGGWNHGAKEQISGFATYFKEGYAVANVAYRLTPQATAPAAVQDVRCALIYIINHAKELNVDLSRIVFTGSSAGAHLALMGGYLQNNRTYDAHCTTDQKVHIAAVINRYGITDLASFFSYKSVSAWLGGENLELAKQMSPISYIDAQTPPTFTVHGDADPVVPYSQAVLLNSLLLKAGVVSEFMTVKGGGHGGFVDPDRKEVEDRVAAFLKQVLQ